jgi:hypothetical protein
VVGTSQVPNLPHPAFHFPHDQTPPHPGACCLWAGADAVTFGMSDLYFREDFRACGSILETCYSVGEEGYPAGETATTLLAGTQEFGCTSTGLTVEVWGFDRG